MSHEARSYSYTFEKITEWYRADAFAKARGANLVSPSHNVDEITVFPRPFSALARTVRGAPITVRALTQLVDAWLICKDLASDQKTRRLGKSVTPDPHKILTNIKNLQNPNQNMTQPEQLHAAELSKALTQLLHHPNQAFAAMKTLCESRRLDTLQGPWPTRRLQETTGKVETKRSN